MCLNVSYDKTAAVLKKFKRRENLYFWKVFDAYYFNKQLEIVSPYQGYEYKIGWHVLTNRELIYSPDVIKDLRGTAKDGFLLSKGFHLCATKEKTTQITNCPERIALPIECHKDDFIVAGHNDDILFSRIYFSYKNWKQCLDYVERRNSKKN